MFGLSVPEMRCLAAMEMDGCGTSTDLADNLCLGKSRVTRILDSLAAKGYIVRRQNDRDRRVQLVELTETGKRLAETVGNTLLELHSEVLLNLPEDYRERTVNTLGELSSAMKNVKKKLQAASKKSGLWALDFGL